MLGRENRLVAMNVLSVRTDELQRRVEPPGWSAIK
jgi:hypothetical protein